MPADETPGVGRQVPSWLLSTRALTPEAAARADELLGERERLAEDLAYGVLVADESVRESALKGMAAIQSLLPHEVVAQPLLDQALAGLVTAPRLVEWINDADALGLDDEELSTVENRPFMLRLLALSRHIDVGISSLTRYFLPAGATQVVLGLRASTHSQGELLSWLKAHPEYTGLPDATWAS